MQNCCSAGSALIPEGLVLFRFTSGPSVCFVHKSAFLAPVEGSAPEKRMLMSHSSDSSCFKWTLLVELAQCSCPFSSKSLSEVVLEQPETSFSQSSADALGICSLCTPLVQPAHPGTVHWQNSGSHSSLNPDARRSRREIWAWLICYSLTHRYTLPFNE